MGSDERVQSRVQSPRAGIGRRAASKEPPRERSTGGRAPILEGTEVEDEDDGVSMVDAFGFDLSGVVAAHVGNHAKQHGDQHIEAE